MDNGAENYRRFLKGDDSGIGEIVREYREGLMLYIRTFVNDIHTAEDLTEDTFFRLMIRKPKFSEKSSFKSWLYAIGRHIAIDYVRKNAGTERVPLEDVTELLRDEEDLEQSYLKEDRRILVHRMLETLPADYRQVIYLVYLEGFTNQEAGVVMNRSSGQIANLLYRAKQALKEALIKGGFDNEEF